MLLALWKHECKRVIADRFTMPEDVEWFDQALAKLVEEELGDEHKSIVGYGQDRYFVDFLRDAPEATGTERDGHILTGFPVTVVWMWNLSRHRGRAGRFRLWSAEGLRAGGVVWEFTGSAQHVLEPLQREHQGHRHGHGLLWGCHDTSCQGTLKCPSKTSHISKFLFFFLTFYPSFVCKPWFVCEGFQDHPDAWG